MLAISLSHMAEAFQSHHGTLSTRNFGALFRDCCQGCQDVLSLPRAIFASNRRCEAGVQTNPCLQAPGTRNSCSKPGEPPELSSGRRCRASTQVWCGTRHYCSRTREVTWGLLAQWVLLRLFPLIASNDSPAPSFFSGTDRVTVILPIHVVLLWCQRFRLRQCAVPAPMANSGDTFCGPTVLSFIADQPLL
jgi:hypothetical protein